MNTIENKYLKISIKKLGGELCSLFNKTTNTEMLWQGDPAFWNGQAPILFPIIGNIKNESYNYNEKSYSMGRHGFARRSKDWKIEIVNESTIKCSLQSNNASLEVYPFPFTLEVIYHIENKTLHVNHTIVNTGKSALPFSIGGHTAYQCVVNEDSSYSDYFLKFSEIENEERHFLTEQGLLNGKTETVLNNSDTLTLHPNLFDDDALIFKTLKSNKISLHGPKGKLLSVAFNDFPFIGIWATPKAPFVCIEPWIGHADTVKSTQNLFDKEGSKSLESNQSFKASYQITLA